MKSLSIIVAVSDNGVIGVDNQLPWHIPMDLHFFKKITTGGTIIMGRKCYESIGRPLPKRQNIVITKQDIQIEGCEIAHNILGSILLANNDEIFIIGGAQIYEQSFNLADTLYLTRVNEIIEGDTYLKGLDMDKWVLMYKMGPYVDNGFEFYFEKYSKKLDY